MMRFLIKGDLLTDSNIPIGDEIELLWPIGQCNLCDYEFTEEDREASPICPNCSSRPRQRSLPILMNVLHGLLKPNNNGELLAFAMTAVEEKFVAHHFSSIKSVSLFGNYAKNHIEGVDVRNLEQFNEGEFSGAFSLLLFDYFPEHHIALKELHRVIRKGGLFFTHIANGRILEGDVPAYIHKQVYAKKGSFEYLNDNSIPSIKVGRDWLFNTIDECGFDPCTLDILDPATNEYYTWFIGRRR
jgi:SAM-dependent methyltransferase